MQVILFCQENIKYMEDEKSVRFSITLALDKDEFIRMSCPSCGREFKTQADPADLSSILQPAFRRIESEIGEIPLSTAEGETNPIYLSCPYCNHRAEWGDMLTAEFQNYLKRFVIREYVLLQINNIFSDFADGLRSTSRSTPFFSIEVKVDSENTLPPRPISGPEPPDMTKIELLCCGRAIKVYDNWFDLEKCPFCESEVRII